MARAYSIPLHLIHGDARSPGRWEGIEYNRRDRLVRAVTVWSVCWAGAVVLVFTLIPVVHIIGALALAVAGPVMGIRRLLLVQSAQRARGDCPVCRKFITLEMDATDRLPHWAYCPACGASLQLLAANEAGEIKE